MIILNYNLLIEKNKSKPQEQRFEGANVLFSGAPVFFLWLGFWSERRIHWIDLYLSLMIFGFLLL